ncbi:hypothetical protein LCGC14_2579980 [marine sediment metagenome]|uniref:Uncharacterized protein n=1 Tax=marine sediment metagenome TaxID=412755 RepID=A0A0F9AEM5_9ZZZZ
MSFANTDSIVADDLNNMLRGLSKDNSDNAHTGDTAETDLASVTLAANSMGTTGGIHVLAWGTTTGTAGTKTIRGYFGGTAVGVGLIVAQADADEWIYEFWIYNTSTSAQIGTTRAMKAAGSGGASEVFGNYSATFTIDTTASVIVKMTGELGNGGDTVTQKGFNILVIEPT